MSNADDFDEFVRGSSTSLFRTAVLLAGDRSAAQDLLQTAYERTLRHWRSASTSDPTAYARRALANAAIDSWRRRRRLGLLPHVRPRVHQDADAQSAIEVRGSLIAGLLTLPIRQRTVLVLRYWEDQSEAQTAAIMGCSIGTVKSQASRGLAQLRTSLATAGTDASQERTAQP